MSNDAAQDHKKLSILPFGPSAAFSRMAAPANNNYLINPENKKVTILLGSQISAHFAALRAVRELADLGIPCDIFMTDLLIKGPKMAEKLSLPEIANFAFFDKIMNSHGYDFMESQPLLLDKNGDLRHELCYSPRQIAQFYTERGVEVNFETVKDINAPEFIDRIYSDDRIARTYNARNMQILSNRLIEAFENKTTADGLKSQVVNLHPADVLLLPGTNTAFWARKLGFMQHLWTLHLIIDEGIDTGPIVAQTNPRALKPGKTLMQDMCSMAPNAADIIVRDALKLFHTHKLEQAKDQKDWPGFRNKPHTNYSFATHEEHFQGVCEGIVDVNPHEYIPALARAFTGDLCSEISQELNYTLAKPAIEWQQQYVDLYRTRYGYNCPRFSMMEDLGENYFLQDPKPPKKTNCGPANDIIPAQTVSEPGNF